MPTCGSHFSLSLINYLLKRNRVVYVVVLVLRSVINLLIIHSVVLLSSGELAEISYAFINSLVVFIHRTFMA